MKALNKKLGKNGGFTLIEMLIVVAIIAILVAISIPLINNALERARDATDQANERSAKAEAVLLYMGLAVDQDGDELEFKANHPYYYSAKNGSLVDSSWANTYTGPVLNEKYGKCTMDHDGDVVFLSVTSSGAADEGKHKGMVLTVEVDENGVVTLTWG